MDRRHKRKQERYRALYQQIQSYPDTISIKEICKILRISSSTYYRIIIDQSTLVAGTINTPVSQYINQPAIFDSLTCPVSNCQFKERCPMNTRVKITTQDPIFSSFLLTHTSFVSDYVITK